MTYAETHSQETEHDYPYHGLFHLGCKAKESMGIAKVKSINEVTPGSVEQLKAAIAQGPTSVTVEADQTVFQSYKSGILNSSKCGTKLDHAITAVGYGSENGQDYYIVRNSWGATWGEKGYIRIAAVEGDGICGIQQISVWPTVTYEAQTE